MYADVIALGDGRSSGFVFRESVLRAIVAADEQLLVADRHENSAILDLPIALRTFLYSHDNDLLV